MQSPCPVATAFQKIIERDLQFSSVAQSCPTLDPAVKIFCCEEWSDEDGM